MPSSNRAPYEHPLTEEPLAWELWHKYFAFTDAHVNGDLKALSYTDATRGDPGTPGRIIFNTDDSKLNIDTGSDWTLPDGSVT